MADDALQTLVDEMGLDLPSVSEPHSNEGKNLETDDSNNNDIDFKDVPNGQIRFDKMKQERNDARNATRELELKVAKFEGHIEASKKNEGPPENDPEDYMSDTEKFLNKRTNNLETALKEAIDVIKKIQSKDSLTSMEKAENHFFDNHPDFKARREQIVENAAEFLSKRPEFKSMLQKQTISFNELIAMVESNSNNSDKKIVSSKAGDYFSGNNTLPSDVIRKNIKTGDILKKANEILDGKPSIIDGKSLIDKSKAMDVLLEENVSYLSGLT